MKIRTSDFQVAKTVPIEDAGGYYIGIEVESALQIIGKSRADSAHYTGFPNRSDTSLSWDDVTYTLTLTATADKIWINGIEYEIDTLTKQLSVAQEAVTGLYWYWITAPGGVPQINTSTVSPNIGGGGANSGFDQCIVATVYWNTTTSAGLLSDERHWFGRDAWMHEYLHETIGARYADGMPGTFANTTFEIGSGEFYDEDIEHENDTETVATVLYHDGDDDWAWDVNTSTPYLTDGTDLQYNNGTALASANNNRFVVYYFFMTPDTVDPVHIVIGTAQYTTLAGAEAAIIPSLGALPSAENKLIYKVIYRNISGGTHLFQSATDFRQSSNLPSSGYVATDHGALSGREDDDHIGYPWLLGRIGGQTLIGSTLTTETLVLQDNAVDGNTITVTEAIAAYAHIGESGASHTYINQDVTTTAGVTFNSVTLGGGGALLDMGGYSIQNGLNGTFSGDLTASRLLLDGTQFYTSTDDLYIKNTNQDKDVLINVNDGGVDTTAIFVDGSTSRVGIKNVMPGYDLDVNGTINIVAEERLRLGGAVFATYKAAETDFTIGSSAAGIGIRFDVGGVTDAMYLEPTTGNVGIGTTSPVAPLHVVQAGSGLGFRVDDNVGDTNFFCVTDTGRVGIAGDDSPGGSLDVLNGRFVVMTDGSLYASSLNAFATRAAAGTDEIFVTSGHATLPDGVLMLGT